MKNERTPPMSSPIPASPIPQPTPKIGTRYVCVASRPTQEVSYFYDCGLAATNKQDAMSECLADDAIYVLLDPTDAAELERLRGVEDEAADAFICAVNESSTTHQIIALVPWNQARANRIAFEKKIGGGS